MLRRRKAESEPKPELPQGGSGTAPPKPDYLAMGMLGLEQQFAGLSTQFAGLISAVTTLTAEVASQREAHAELIRQLAARPEPRPVKITIKIVRGRK